MKIKVYLLFGTVLLAAAYALPRVSAFGFLLLILPWLLWAAWFRPGINKKAHLSEFRSRVLGVVDGLYLSGMDFKCADFEIRAYVKDCIDKLASLPGNVPYAEYTRSDGWVYSAYNSDHVLFALICILEYANDDENDNLVLQCESM